MMLMQRLKQETQPYHSALEQSPRSAILMSQDLTLNDYATLLKKFYGFHLPLEAALGRFDWPSLGFQFDPRRKLSYLERDLALLKIAPQQLPICTALPPLPAIPQALGCLYVMEGSTLGGQIITRHLKKHLNLGQFHYYASYGEQVGPLWKSFGEMVNSSTSDPATESLVIEGAIHTFKALQVWLEA